VSALRTRRQRVRELAENVVAGMDGDLRVGGIGVPAQLLSGLSPRATFMRADAAPTGESKDYNQLNTI
jgi:hypothetical protein